MNSPASSDPLLILIPVYNDWPALQKLLALLDRALEGGSLAANVLIVDDASTVAPEAAFSEASFRAIDRLDVLKLRRNLGHQRAIAIGLAYVEVNVPCQAVVLMDSDGEDDPFDVPRLVKQFRSTDGHKIIFADRVRRSETWVFRGFYTCYKFLHYLLTGYTLRIGNFSLVPRSRLRCLVAVSEIWNHYAAAVFKSRQPLDLIPTQRASRLHGKPTMSFINLVIHGLSAISVLSDVVGVRLLVVSFVLIVVLFGSILTAISVRLLTDLAVPGWATYTTGLLVVILLQAVMFVFVFCMMILNNRQAASFLPLRDYAYFVDALTPVYRK